MQISAAVVRIVHISNYRPMLKSAPQDLCYKRYKLVNVLFQSLFHFEKNFRFPVSLVEDDRFVGFESNDIELPAISDISDVYVLYSIALPVRIGHIQCTRHRNDHDKGAAWQSQ